MSELKKQSWLQSFSLYKDIRMLRILLLGSISGFPWVLTIGMILGRLELFAILVLFLPYFWRN